MNETKQVIVIRKDLGMRKGKFAAQAAHASIAVFLKNPNIKKNTLSISIDDDIKDWLITGQAKIVVFVESEQELLDLYDAAKRKDIRCSLIIDAGRTEFDGLPTKTAIAIGPAQSSIIDTIT